MRGVWSLVAGTLTVAFVAACWLAAITYTDNAQQEMLERVEVGE